MLYLVRKLNESIIINDNIEVKVIDIKGKSVKLGFEFPSTATILRKEVHERIVAENLAAAMVVQDIGDVNLDAFSGAGTALSLEGVSDVVCAAAEAGQKKSLEQDKKSSEQDKKSDNILHGDKE